MPIQQYTFVTGSSVKVAEAERILRTTLVQADVDLPEIQEVDVTRVIAEKARVAWEALGRRPVLVEDTGLSLDAWNGLPGALVKWFVRSVGCSGICSMADGFADRSATATTVVAVHDGQVRMFAGNVRGRIADLPRGTGGFGWDPVFIPDGADMSFSEMSPEEKDRYSMRRIALESLRASVSDAP